MTNPMLYTIHLHAIKCKKYDFVEINNKNMHKNKPRGKIEESENLQQPQGAPGGLKNSI